MTTIAVSDFRSNLPTLIDQVSEGLRRFVITVSGEPKAVVLSLDELESLEETAEVLSNPSILQELKDSRRQIREGKFVTLEKVEKKYGLTNRFSDA